MDWPLAIRRNRDALRRIVAVLFAMAGLKVGGSLVTLPRGVFQAVLFILRPAESAVRRLIVIAAHGLEVSSLAKRAAPVGLAPRDRSARLMAFPLLDPLKQFDAEGIWDVAPPALVAVSEILDPALGFRAVPSLQEPVSAKLLGLRLNALMRALDDLPRQARRLVRWKAQRDLALRAKSPYSPIRLSPIRPGLAPGRRQRASYEIDDVLRECHGLALDRMNAP